MKLTRLYAHQFGRCNGTDLRGFSNGLNVVFGANGSGKSTLRNLMRGIWFGFDKMNLPASVASNPEAGGAIEVQDPRGHFRINRNIEALQRGKAKIIQLDAKTGFDYETPPHTHAAHRAIDFPPGYSVSSIEELAKRISALSYDAFFDVGFRDSHNNVTKIAHQLKNELNVSWKQSNWNNDADYWQWKREADLRVEQLNETISEIDRLQAEKRRLQNELEHGRQWQHRIDELNTRLAKLETEIHSLELRRTGLIADIERCEREMETLRVKIEQLESTVKQVPIANHTPDRVAALYRKLDNIDDQLRRWRRVQKDVQTQRLNLRDDMVAWSQSTIDLTEYPFGQAHQKITDLESKILQVQNHADHWIEKIETPVSSQDSPRQVKSLCDQMKDDVYALCNELGTLQAYIKRRSTVVEMKQLRRCYAELSENIKRLIEQRHSTIDELKELDPAGVAAIQRAELHFCECAEHDGYLTARQRFVGQALYEEQYETLRYDAVAEREQLKRLQDDHERMLQTYNSIEQELSVLKSEQERLIIERNDIAGKSDEHDLLVQRDRIEVKLGKLSERRRTLQAQVEEDRRWFEVRPNEFMASASSWLCQLTQGHWNQLWIDESSQLPVVTRDSQSPDYFAKQSRSNQDLITLALVMAGAESFAKRGVRMPILLDDALLNLERVQLENTLDTLIDFVASDHQVILFSGLHQPMAVFASRNVTVQELPDTTIVPRPFERPQEEWRSIPEKSFARQYVETLTTSWDAEPLEGTDRRSSEWIAKSIESAVPTDHETSISAIGLVDFESAQSLKKSGVVTLQDLMDWDPESIEYTGLSSIGNNTIQRWQDQAILLVAIPGLRVIDARVLTECGIEDAFELESLTTLEIQHRLTAFLKSDSGRHYAVIASDFDGRRIDAWKRSMQRTRSRWARSSRNRSRQVTRNRSSDRDQTRGSSQSVRLHRESTTSRKASSRSKKSSKSSSESYRFYLELTDEVEAAPSIGPRTAERLGKAGVISVADLLDLDAEDIVANLDYKRIKVNHIKDWQHQTELVCTVPNLRGHDAQILVACGIKNAKQLAEMEPKTLLGMVEPFSKTKEGIKLLRTNKRPDLAEVTDWVDWAQHMRSVKAA